MMTPFAALLFAAAAVTADPARHAVSFEAVSTGVGADTSLEFLIVGPGSDHAYEALFETCDSVVDIAAAFDRAGIPRGEAISSADCRFWPVGATVRIEPDPMTFLREDRGDKTPSVVLTSGSRDAKGLPVAETTMPAAVFALYSLPQSLMQWNDALDQSATYGRFKPLTKPVKGQRVRFTVSWDGKTFCRRETVKFSPGGEKSAMLGLRQAAATNEVSVIPDLDPALTLAEAKRVAAALAAIDSPRVKVNGYRKEQFFYRAFLPLEKWRDRRERLTQPYEIRFSGGKPALTIITEDWSDENSTDPKLSAKVGDFAALPTGDKTDTCIVYAAADMRLGELYALKKLLPTRVVNWYVYEGE